MGIFVSFSGTAPIPGADTGFRIWSYTVTPSSPGEIPAGQQIALALPLDVDIRDPAHFPGVPALAGAFLVRDTAAGRQYAGRVTGPAGTQTISFVAPAAQSTGEVLLVRLQSNALVVALPFSVTPNGPQAPTQRLIAPIAGRPVFQGRPLTDFTGMLPYASEVFGVYQPLVNWLGAQNTVWALGNGETGAGLGHDRFFGPAARALDDEVLAEIARRFGGSAQSVLSPVGLVNLFRQYFFEFDTFLGAPAGHLWLSPGGTVEVVETSTRRTLVERTAEQAEETSRKVEESLTEQDDVADAVKEENANDTKLGVSATGGVNAPIFHADASASFTVQSTVKRSAEETHKHARTQSSKVTSEIKRNYKTTFKTVTETTDTSSRRYVVQNTTGQLVNYELRRKMRKVGVQLQHIGSRLAWQIYIDKPGRHLGLGDMVDLVTGPDLTGVQRPEIKTHPAEQKVTHSLSLPFILHQGADDEAENTYTLSPENGDHGIHKPTAGTNNIIQFRFDFPLPPPPPGFEVNRLGFVDFRGAQVQFTTDPTKLGMQLNPDPAKNSLGLRLTHANFQSRKSLPFDVSIIYTPTATTKADIDKANAEAKAAYDKQIAQLQREAYGQAVRDRLRKVSRMQSRPAEDLRSEERQTVFRSLLFRVDLGPDPHLGAEVLQQMFDVDEMLYFVAPDYWRPRTPTPPPPHPVPPEPSQSSVGRYPVPPLAGSGGAALTRGDTVVSWYSHTDQNNAIDPLGHSSEEWRVNYLITDDSLPAPLGSSLGWLIQTDGDERRNEFLNAAWVKAVLPVRPGQEARALELLRTIEGEAVFDKPYPVQPGDPPEYQGLTVGEVLRKLAAKVQADNTDPAAMLAAEKVFETGFDPLAGGFRPAEPYQVFDQWVEVLPTDQIVAVAVQYDPKTGQQL
ncbi:hypothetical protein [Bailinhaonella thermotolerans]|uniref:Uncharacterized protein n=1 Tax=Bailinhaonella thermotolerans TaxID=1070861 RepID=A0A3A4AZX2_9ACTN|nr:hypothetical protein [Bailinhaonella thermotolerans]RJL35947.1 hypothetical protein D5H75_04040 [Bailinhaonella thermotolerans]